MAKRIFTSLALEDKTDKDLFVLQTINDKLQQSYALLVPVTFTLMLLTIL